MGGVFLKLINTFCCNGTEGSLIGPRVPLDSDAYGNQRSIPLCHPKIKNIYQNYPFVNTALSKLSKTYFKLHCVSTVKASTG